MLYTNKTNVRMQFDCYCALLTFIVNMIAFFSLKGKKGVTITDAFLKKVFYESSSKLKKIWLQQASEFSWINKPL